MNSFGRIFRVSIFGESHGPAVGVLLDGCPAGIPLDEKDFESDLERRRAGTAGTTSRLEPDRPRLLGGIFEGRTTGAPLLIQFANEAADSALYDAIRTTPRPGHADFTAWTKFGGYHDHRGGGPFSGRLTVGLVAAGVVAKRIISPIRVAARLIEAGGSRDIEAAVQGAVGDGQTIGGVVEVVAEDVPAGIGEPFFDPVESLLGHVVFAIPAVKGIEFGVGFAAARMTGESVNDAIVSADGRTLTNNAGGVLGGITNGNPLVFRVAFKPAPSQKRPQRTVDVVTGEAAEVSAAGRHDVCLALRTPVIVEAATALVLADLLLLEQRRSRVWRREGGT